MCLCCVCVVVNDVERCDVIDESFKVVVDDEMVMRWLM